MRISQVLARTVSGRLRMVVVSAVEVAAGLVLGGLRWFWDVVVVVDDVGVGCCCEGGLRVRRSAAGGRGERPRREGERLEEVVARRVGGRRPRVEGGGDAEGVRLGEAGLRGVDGSVVGTSGSVVFSVSVAGAGVGICGVSACDGPQGEEQSGSWTDDGAVVALHSDSGTESAVATLQVWDGLVVTVRPRVLC
jgi:hypothetical protein